VSGGLTSLANQLARGYPILYSFSFLDRPLPAKLPLTSNLDEILSSPTRALECTPV
jgi:hypothetical protein